MNRDVRRCQGVVDHQFGIHQLTALAAAAHLLQLRRQPAVTPLEQLHSLTAHQLLQRLLQDPATGGVRRAHHPLIVEGDHAARHALEDRLLVVLQSLQIAIALAQLTRHRVERQREVVHLIDGAAADALIEIAAGHVVSGVGDPLQGLAHQSRRAAADQHHQGEAHQHHNQAVEQRGLGGRQVVVLGRRHHHLPGQAGGVVPHLGHEHVARAAQRAAFRQLLAELRLQGTRQLLHQRIGGQDRLLAAQLAIHDGVQLLRAGARHEEAALINDVHRRTSTDLQVLQEAGELNRPEIGTHHTQRAGRGAEWHREAAEGQGIADRPLIPDHLAWIKGLRADQINRLPQGADREGRQRSEPRTRALAADLQLIALLVALNRQISPFGITEMHITEPREQLHLGLQQRTELQNPPRTDQAAIEQARIDRIHLARRAQLRIDLLQHPLTHLLAQFARELVDDLPGHPVAQTQQHRHRQQQLQGEGRKHQLRQRTALRQTALQLLDPDRRRAGTQPMGPRRPPPRLRGQVPPGFGIEQRVTLGLAQGPGIARPRSAARHRRSAATGWGIRCQGPSTLPTPLPHPNRPPDPEGACG